MRDDDVRVVAVEATGPVAKVGKAFRVGVLYRLVDGTEETGGLSLDRKKDVLPYLAGQHAAAEGGRLAAFFVDGRFAGTSCSYRLGGAA